MIRERYLAAALQLQASADPVATLAQAEALVQEAAARGARLVGLPENALAIPESPAEALALLGEWAPKAHALYARLAQAHGLTLFAGVPAPGPEGKAWNELRVWNPQGEQLANYRKRHLFDVALGGHDDLQESATVARGEALVAPDLGPLGVLGLSICYDLRFPEHFRALVDRGAELLAVPAAFLVATGMDHWRVLLRARAIENTCYVLAPAQAGRHGPTRRSYGHAMVVDPWGEVLADAGGPESGPGLALAFIDPARLAQVRRQLPCLQHRLETPR